LIPLHSPADGGCVAASLEVLEKNQISVYHESDA
jgi:hypothetical protein